MSIPVTPEDILTNKFIKGEISEEEYKKQKYAIHQKKMQNEQYRKLYFEQQAARQIINAQREREFKLREERKAKIDKFISILKSKKFIIIIICIFVIIASVFTVNYNNLPNKAKGEIGIYLAKHLPGYVSMHNVNYTVDFNTSGYKVVLGGNVKNKYKHSVTLYCEIQYNYLMCNSKIKLVKIDGKKFNISNSNKYTFGYWW